MKLVYEVWTDFEVTLKELRCAYVIPREKEGIFSCRKKRLDLFWMYQEVLWNKKKAHSLMLLSFFVYIQQHSS